MGIYDKKKVLRKQNTRLVKNTKEYMYEMYEDQHHQYKNRTIMNTAALHQFNEIFLTIKLTKAYMEKMLENLTAAIITLTSITSTETFSNFDGAVQDLRYNIY